jgi:hypothetical protein
MDEPQIYARLSEIFEEVFDEDSMVVTHDLSAKDQWPWKTMTSASTLVSLGNGISPTQAPTGSVGGMLLLMVKRTTSRTELSTTCTYRAAH